MKLIDTIVRSGKAVKLSASQWSAVRMYLGSKAPEVSSDGGFFLYGPLGRVYVFCLGDPADLSKLPWGVDDES